MKVSYEWEKRGKMMVSSTVSLQEISRINRNSNEDFGQRHEALKRLQEPTIFSDKICSLEAQKRSQPPFGITKYYRWLTVAPLGDGAFLKASRIQT